MFKDKRELTKKYYQLEKHYTTQKTNKEKLRVLQEMLEEIPEGKYEYNKVRSHITHKMRLLREQIKKEEKREEAIKKSRQYFKTEMFTITLIGDANTGKTKLLNQLCNTKHQSTIMPYETREVIKSVMNHKGIKIRIVEIPSAIKPEHARILRESNLIIIMPNSERYKQYVKEYEIETPTKTLKEYPTNNWEFTGLIKITINNKSIITYKGTTLNDLDINKAIVNNQERESNYKLKEEDKVKII